MTEYPTLGKESRIAGMLHVAGVQFRHVLRSGKDGKTTWTNRVDRTVSILPMGVKGNPRVGHFVLSGERADVVDA
jgi:hypothetical protein